MSRPRAVLLLWILVVSAAAAASAATYAVSDQGGEFEQSEWAAVALTVAVADAGGMVTNPHSDLIFRATGATTCVDCHRAGKEGQMTAQVQDNALVQELKAKAKGIHGPGRFADCLRCHAGGNKGVERYRK